MGSEMCIRDSSCGEDGLPHLIVDGRWSHAGDFVYPGIMFLYVAGCIGWAGREYLKATRGKNAAQYEIFIDRSIAIKSLLAAARRLFNAMPRSIWISFIAAFLPRVAFRYSRPAQPMQPAT